MVVLFYLCRIYSLRTQSVCTSNVADTISKFCINTMFVIVTLQKITHTYL